ncbi:MAG TPA: hypothetical protein VGR96_09345 [Acidobacteriaceae bacterium]|nr:hypothetical protein [Acidobacteriaceae bacterium]
MEQRILNGWKEISSHLERGTRTAQRWEIQFGMPVHRPAMKRRTAVIAFAEELDEWLMRNRSSLNGGLENGNEEPDPARLQEALLRLQTEAKELAAKLMYLERHLQAGGVEGRETARKDAAAEV